MKTKVGIIICLFAFLFIGNVFPQYTIQRVRLDGNNIDAFFQNTGIFNQNTTSGHTSGFIWPKGSGKTAVFTSGLCIGARVNGQIAQTTASYKGEYAPGRMIDSTAFSNGYFKFYKISRGDNENTNPDYALWFLMVPFGAPYIDVNNNHQFDNGIDSIGIRNASQVIFICMTDGFASSHSPGEGFGGGVTNPLLKSQVAWTSWCYDKGSLKDIQFMKWSIINKSTATWNSTYLSIASDVDLGDAGDDYIGCDTTLKLGYCYNADNIDGNGLQNTYGVAPPAYGMIFHKSPRGFTSFNRFIGTGASPPPCEADPNGEPHGAYLMMKGYKKDSSKIMNPTFTPPIPTKFSYSGDPETNTGWTMYKGYISNCGGDTGTIYPVCAPFDYRSIMSSGAENFTVNPNDTVTLIVSQLMARGTSNLNSVTKLKEYALTAWEVYNGGFSVGIQNISTEIPSAYSLSQNYPNPFNPNTNVKFSIVNAGEVKLVVYDVMGREVQTLVNESLQAGTYEATFDGSMLNSGVYFYKLIANGQSETKKMLMIK
jgi:hypothetical protein